MQRVLRAGAVIAMMFFALGCRGTDKQPAANANDPQQSLSFGTPTAVKLFRSGIEAQCKAAAEKKARYLRTANGKAAAVMRAEYEGRAMPTADEVRRACVERNRGRTVAGDIMFALDIDPEKVFARAAELEGSPYRDADGTIHPGHGFEEALVEAILASDERLASSDWYTFCFGVALKLVLFVDPTLGMLPLDNCIGARPAEGTQEASPFVIVPGEIGNTDRLLRCIADAQRRAQALECLVENRRAVPLEDGEFSDLLTGEGERPPEENDLGQPRADMSKPRPRDAGAR